MQEAGSEVLPHFPMAIDTHCWPMKPYVFALHCDLEHSLTQMGIPILHRLSGAHTVLDFSRIDHVNHDFELLVEFSLMHHGHVVKEWRQQRHPNIQKLVPSVTSAVTAELIKLADNSMVARPVVETDVRGQQIQQVLRSIALLYDKKSLP